LKTYEFEANLNGGCILQIPDTIAAEIGPETSVRVILTIGDISPEEDRLDEVAWIKSGARCWFEDDSPGDELYDRHDKLPAR
jgi:hypothetical protein